MSESNQKSYHSYQEWPIQGCKEDSYNQNTSYLFLYRSYQLKDWITNLIKKLKNIYRWLKWLKK